MQLSKYNSEGFNRGRSAAIEYLWNFIQGVAFSSCIPGSAWRKFLLVMFGSKVGNGVVIKPGARVKFPWRLVVGDYSWIGEGVWIDNLAVVEIGSDCCISQDVYICTGNHNWSSKAFDLIIKPVKLKNHVWIAARCTMGPGVIAEEGSVLSLGSVITGDMEPWTVYSGNPAKPVRKRMLS